VTAVDGTARETIREKIAQARRLQLQVSDPLTTEKLKMHLEDLEAQLLVEMSAGPTETGPTE
jgi:ethanolamine ammonia-lyase small subunit